MKDINWNNVDWTKKTVELAAELGVSTATVSYHRRNMHHRRHQRGTWMINWRGVDWTKPNFEIGNEVLATPSAVANARLRYAPDHLKHGRLVEGACGKSHLETVRRIQHQHETPAMYPAVYIIEVQKQPVTPKPTGLRGLLIKLSDWLVSLCVSVKKEVAK